MLDSDHFKRLEEIYSTMDFRRYFEAARNRYSFTYDSYAPKRIMINDTLVFLHEKTIDKDKLKESFNQLDEVDKYAFLRTYILNNVMSLWGSDNNPYRCYKLFDNMGMALQAYLYMVNCREYDNITRIYATGTIYTASGKYSNFSSSSNDNMTQYLSQDGNLT